MAERRDMRASDADRERAAERLRRAAAEGRLDTDELEERLEAALGARTYAELEAVVADLPRSPRPRRAGASRRRRRGVFRRGFVAISVLLIAIWALTGAGYFWPGWAIGGLALWAFSPGCGRRTAVGSRRDGVQALRP